MSKMLNIGSLKKYKKVKPKNIDEIIRMNKKIKHHIELLIKKWLCLGLSIRSD